LTTTNHTMRKLYLVISALIVFFSSCNSNSNQAISESYIPIFADTTGWFFSKDNLVINLNIKYINDAYKFEKQLGSKISYLAQGVNFKTNFNVPTTYYDSIMSPKEIPAFVIFHRPEKYEFPLNVI